MVTVTRLSGVISSHILGAKAALPTSLALSSLYPKGVTEAAMVNPALPKTPLRKSRRDMDDFMISSLPF
jgi:hypothetical protein